MSENEASPTTSHAHCLGLSSHFSPENSKKKKVTVYLGSSKMGYDKTEKDKP